MFSKKFLIADLCIEFRSENPIDDTNFFPEFLTNANPDIVIDVVEGQLPERQGTVLGVDEKKARYFFENKTHYFSSYFDQNRDSYIDYACLVRESHSNFTLFVDYEKGMWDTMIFDAVNFPSLLTEKNAFLIHSSFIAVNGYGIIFSADKQVGKSTQASLWQKYRNAEIINGDRSVLKAENGTVTVFGTPVCGSSNISVNKNVPLKAIVLLEQAKENSAELISPAESFRLLLNKITYNTRDKAEMNRVISALIEIIGNVPVIRLRCLPDEGAVKTLEEILCQTD